MNNKQYSSCLKKNQFRYIETRKVAKLMLENKSKEEIYNICVTNNYIEIESIARRTELTYAIYNRLILLDPYLLDRFYNDDVSTSKFILVYAIAKSNDLFFEFMQTIYTEAMNSIFKRITIDDFQTFFEQKKKSDLIVSKWSKNTIEQLSSGYRNILVESNFARREKKNLYVKTVVIDPNVEKHIQSISDEMYLKALYGNQ